MGATNFRHYSPEIIQKAKILRGLQHPARVAILELILDMEYLTLTDIISNIKLSQPSLSHHLKIMRESEILIAINEGNSVKYSINYDILNFVKNYFDDLSWVLSAK